MGDVAGARRPGPTGVGVVCRLYAVAACALWGVAGGCGNDRWWLALIGSAALFGFAPLPLLALLAVARRRWVALGILTMPAAFFGLLYGELFVPRPAPEVEGPRIRAMSFNLLGANLRYDAMAESIRAADADIVALQELTPLSARALTEALGERFPYRTIEPYERATSVGLISRYPIEQITWLDLPPMHLAFHATLRVEGRRLHVVVAHLTPTLLRSGLAGAPEDVRRSYASRADEAWRLLLYLRRLDGPALLLCDCNMTETSSAYRVLSLSLGDSFREAGWGFGLTLLGEAPVPLQRVDYIWHTRELAALDAWVGRPGGSDHLPVVADLGWLRSEGR